MDGTLDISRLIFAINQDRRSDTLRLDKNPKYQGGGAKAPLTYNEASYKQTESDELKHQRDRVQALGHVA